MKKLFSEFPLTTTAQWKEQLTNDLKGTSFNQLIWQSNSNIDINPFYTKDDLLDAKESVFNYTDWDICEPIIVTNAQTANTQALTALAGGASGLVFFISTEIDVSILLKNISVDHIYIQFFISFNSINLLNDLKLIYGKINSIENKLKCFINADPLYSLAFNGKWHANQLTDLSILNQLVHIPVTGSLYQEAGANTINELAITLAHLNEFLNYLSENKNLATQTIHLNMAINADFFNEIAKLRAVKKIINLLLTQYHVSLPIHIHSQTTQINNSSLDANNNMLRTTTEAMSAILGGSNSLLIFPYNFSYEQPTEFSNRIARNQQHILKEECYLNKMADVSAGSYYIETLTDVIAEKAWEQFKVIESKGGFIKCLETNFIQNLILTDAKRTENEIKLGNIILVGVNKYQQKNEKIIKPKLTPNPVNNEFMAIRPIRYSIPFEIELTN